MKICRGCPQSVVGTSANFPTCTRGILLHPRELGLAMIAIVIVDARSAFRTNVGPQRSSTRTIR